MKMVFALWVLLGGLAVAGELGKPNIVYILADDMGYADAGFLGGKEIKTPSMDALAAKGAVLESFYVQPVCSPTRAVLMTGRYAAHTGVYSVVRPGASWGLPLEERTLPQALREAGYQTAISGKWHLGEFEAGYRPTSRGFDQQYGLWFGAFDYFTHMRDGIRDWHEGGVRVCACVSWPGKIGAGTRIAEPLHGVDWYPTLLKIAGVSAEQERAVDGRDILPVLTEGAKSPHEVILHCGMSPGVAALRMGDWKLVVHGRAGAGAGKAAVKGKKKVELFNLKEDLGEKKNLAADKPEKVAELRKRMEEAFEGAVGMGER